LANVTGGKIEASEYDSLALEVNTVYSDTSNGFGGAATLTFSVSDLVLEDIVPDTNTNNAYTLTASITDSNYIIVEIDNQTLPNSEFNIDTINNQITVQTAHTTGAVIKVYDRYRHIFGWGQEPLSVYPHPTVSTDDIATSKVLEANINNLIDKVNIMTARVGSTVELTRIAKGNKIYPNFSAAKGDINTIDSVIANEVRFDNRTWLNDISTAVENFQTETRTLPWENQLSTAFRWTFSSYNEARYFFNSGGQCRVSVEMTGDPGDPGYANWSQVVNRMGSIMLNWNTSAQTGNAGISDDIGFYNLTSQYQTVFTSGSPATPYRGDENYTGENPSEFPSEYALYSEYVNLTAQIQARFQEASDGRHHVDIRVILDDSAFTNQDIAGTTTFNAGYLAGDNLTDNSATFQSAWTPAIDIINATDDDS
jgi:hypothetical protein